MRVVIGSISDRESDSKGSNPFHLTNFRIRCKRYDGQEELPESLTPAKERHSPSSVGQHVTLGYDFIGMSFKGRIFGCYPNNARSNRAVPATFNSKVDQSVDRSAVNREALRRYM